MSTRRLLLGSIILNLVLLVAVGYSIKQRPPASEQSAGSDQEQKSAPAETSARSRRPTARTHLTTTGFHWRQLESTDYKQYMTNLRAIGCPEDTIRDIIRADVGKLYASRLQTLNTPATAKDSKSWQKDPNAADNEEVQKRNKDRQALVKEQQDLLSELLGIEPEKEQKKPARSTDYYDTRYSFLPEEKRQAFRELTQKYSELEQSVYRNARDVILPQDEAELRRIRDLKKADLAQLLTPQEMEDVSLRDSQTATQMRHELGDFNMSEQDFREIFRIRQGFDEEFNRNADPDDKEFGKRREQAQKQTDAQIKAVLGDQRYAEYQMYKDYEFQNLNRIAKRLEIPKENVLAVYGLKQTVEAQANQIRSDGKLPYQDRQDVMKTLRAEAERQATQALGENGYKAYMRQGGYWIRNLQ